MSISVFLAGERLDAAARNSISWLELILENYKIRQCTVCEAFVLRINARAMEKEQSLKKRVKEEMDKG